MSDFDRNYARDTTAAQNRLMAAHNYLQNITEKIDDDPWAARMHFLNIVSTATKHIEAARALDPNATIIIEDPKTKEVDRQSVDDLARRALFWEGMAETHFGTTEADIRHGIDVLLKTRQYAPYLSSTYKHMGHGHLRLGEIKSAHVCLEEALRLNPADFDAQKMLDGHHGPLLELEKPPPTALDHAAAVFDAGMVIALIGLALLIIGVILLFTGTFSTGFGMIVFGIIIIWVSKFR